MEEAMMLGQFASPAKRQKMWRGDDEPQGDMCLASGSAALSRFSKSKSAATPKPDKSWTASEPCTPGTSSKSYDAVAQDGLLCVSPEQLPASLMLLNQLLGALYVTIPLLKSRGKATTYQNLKVPVQNFCGRDFQVKHIQQIKALCPEALSWEHILTTNPATKKQEQQLLLNMPRSAQDPKKPADPAALQHLFFTKLQQQHCKGHCSDLALAQLPSAAAPSARDCTPSRRSISSQLLPGTPQTAPPAGPRTHLGDSGSSSGGSSAHLMMSPPPKRTAATCARLGAAGAAGLMSPPPARATRGRSRQAGADDARRGFTFSPVPRQLQALSFNPADASPAKNTHSSHLTPVRAGALPTGADAAPAAAAPEARTPALRPNKLFGTPGATSTPQQMSAARPAMQETPPAVLVPDAEAPAAAAGVKVRRLTFESTLSSSAAGKAKAPAKAKSKSGIKFELGDAAMALLKQVSSAEAQQQQADLEEKLDTRRALDMLPGSFDVLRSVFGDRGSCVKPKSEVLLLMRQKSTFKSGMSPAETAEQLDLLMRFVPECIKAITTSGQSLAGLTQSVRINRQITWPAARQKLLQAAAEARNLGVAAAAEAVEADRLEEAQEVTAAAEEAVKHSFPAAADPPQAIREAQKEAAAVSEPSSGVGDLHPSGAPASSRVPVADGLDDVLAQLESSRGGNGGGSSSSNSQATVLGMDGMSAEACQLLGLTGQTNGKQAAPGVSAVMLSCLAFKMTLC